MPIQHRNKKKKTEIIIAICTEKKNKTTKICVCTENKKKFNSQFIEPDKGSCTKWYNVVKWAVKKNS